MNNYTWIHQWKYAENDFFFYFDAIFFAHFTFAKISIEMFFSKLLFKTKIFEGNSEKFTEAYKSNFNSPNAPSVELTIVYYLQSFPLFLIPPCRGLEYGNLRSSLLRCGTRPNEWGTR